jgi:hypothetical protein
MFDLSDQGRGKLPAACFSGLGIIVPSVLFAYLRSRDGYSQPIVCPDAPWVQCAMTASSIPEILFPFFLTRVLAPIWVLNERSAAIWQQEIPHVPVNRAPTHRKILNILCNAAALLL